MSAVTAMPPTVMKGDTLSGMTFWHGKLMNDWAIDCVAAGPSQRRISALSLSMEPASLTAIANDIGTDAIFSRQVIAYGDPGDTLLALSINLAAGLLM